MAREKTITRTMVSGYLYEVMERNGDTMTKVDEITIDTPIRSIKQQKEVLAENEFNENAVLVLKTTQYKKYSMPEAVFMEHATEVTDTSDESEE